MSNPEHPAHLAPLQAGELVEVRSAEEIFATLDSHGMLESLPFMPEMVPLCGQQFRVFRRAHKVMFDGLYFIGRLSNAVFLERARCSGTAHDGCQLSCLLFWKEAWLRRVEESAARKLQPVNFTFPEEPRLVTKEGPRYVCQATELIRAATPWPAWDLRQYWQDIRSANVSVGQLIRSLASDLRRRVLRRFGQKAQVALRGSHDGARQPALNLQAGQWVEVKSREEIAATLDADGRNRGLGIGPEMLACCGKQFRVSHRIERIIVEHTGKLRSISDTVALEKSRCDGLNYRCCPRDCFFLWRECWLKPVEETSPAESLSLEAISVHLPASHS